jgi:hypothetical protein
VAYDVEKSGKSKFTVRAYFNRIYPNGDSSHYEQLLDMLVGAHEGDHRFICPMCDETVQALYLSSEHANFGCVRCHTALNFDETARYWKALQSAVSRKSA